MRYLRPHAQLAAEAVPPCLSKTGRDKGGALARTWGADMVTFLLGVYKRWISPVLPPSCRYVPTCSEYAMEAVQRYGVLRGGMMSAWRLLRCHPFAKGGYDPVVSEQWSVGSNQACCCGEQHRG